MKLPWSIYFWYQLNLDPKPATKKGIIASYEGINIFLTVDDHVIGINDGEIDYLGPKIIGLENAPWIFYGLTKDVSTTTLYLNATKVIEISEGKTIYNIKDFHVEVGDRSHIQVIEQDLSDWVDKRKSMFTLQQETSKEHRLLSTEEQEEQLSNSILALGEMLQDYNAGKAYLFEPILSSLRALVYYKIGNKKYDPLLLRIAAFKNMSLPVYVSPREKGITDLTGILDDSPEIASMSRATFEPRIPNIIMTDFQDYLEQFILASKDEFVSPLVLIERAANTQSMTHYDQRTPLVLEVLKDTPLFSGQNLLKQHILSLAELVVKLGHHVLSSSK